MERDLLQYLKAEEISFRIKNKLLSIIKDEYPEIIKVYNLHDSLCVECPENLTVKIMTSLESYMKDEEIKEGEKMQTDITVGDTVYWTENNLAPIQKEGKVLLIRNDNYAHLIDSNGHRNISHLMKLTKKNPENTD